VRYQRNSGAPTGAFERCCEEADVVVKVAALAVVAFLVFYIMTSPDQAAEIAKSTGHLVGSVAHGIGHFVDKLAS
jgi:hypothetical protein